MLEGSVTRLNEKFNVLMNVNETDKDRFKAIVNWCGSMMDMSVKERFVRDNIQPKRGEIWTAEFGENIGAETNKTRPCLIVQENSANEKAPTLVVVPITSHHPRFFSHVSIEDADLDLLESGHNQPSGTIMMEQIRVMSKARMGKKIGLLNAKGLKKVDKALSLSLGIQ